MAARGGMVGGGVYQRVLATRSVAAARAGTIGGSHGTPRCEGRRTARALYSRPVWVAHALGSIRASGDRCPRS